MCITRCMQQGYRDEVGSHLALVILSKMFSIPHYIRVLVGRVPRNSVCAVPRNSVCAVPVLPYMQRLKEHKNKLRTPLTPLGGSLRLAGEDGNGRGGINHWFYVFRGLLGTNLTGGYLGEWANGTNEGSFKRLSGRGLKVLA